MVTRVPVEMIEGKIITNVRRVSPKTTYFFTDGTFAVVELPIPDDVEQALSAAELAFADHINQLSPPAHTGNIVTPPTPLGELTVTWRIIPAAVLMQSNSAQQAISQPFTVELDIANHTLDTFSDIKFQTVAGPGLIFLDATRVTDLPAPNGISGVHSSDEIQLQGFKLQPGERGSFSIQAQQTVGTPIIGPTPFSVQLVDLSYVKNANLFRTQLSGLPLTANFNLII